MCGEEDGRYDIMSGEWSIVIVLGQIVQKKRVGCISSDGTQRPVLTYFTESKERHSRRWRHWERAISDNAGIIYPVNVRMFLS